ncbi:MAG: hypothetical protein ACYDAE_15350 [Steroidobacteraceae bacterium]
MSSFRASVVPACATALVAAAALTGCASSRLSAEAPPGVHLAGDWKLDPARSDDLGKAVDELRAQRAKALHKAGGGQQQAPGAYTGHRGGGESDGQQGGEAGQGDSSSGPESGGQGVGIGAVQTPYASPVDELMSTVPRGDYLKITVSSSAFTVISGDSTDEYTPGLESDISAEQGDAQQISGWKDAAYEIDTKPQWGAQIIQSFTLTQDGKLSITVRLTGRGTKLTFTRVYDRTTSVAPLAPPTIN